MQAAAPSRKLLLIHAPAGFGKTSLLLQYHALRQQHQAATLWMNLDNADNDLDRFVLHLQSGYQQMISRGIQASPSDSPGLLEQLAAFGKPFSLILDEFEALQNPSVMHFIEQLLHHLPAHGELVIGTRSIPALHLGRLRSRSQILELSHAELRFSLTESMEMITQRPGRPIKARDAGILHDRTEGWPAAIHLAALALPADVDPGTFFASFSGSHAELAQFLAEEILDELSEETLGFLLKTSILHELNAELCDHLTGRFDSKLQLEKLSRDNVFLLPLNNEHTRYRYHGLFASFLHERLSTAHPADLRSLHRRAAQWYLDHDQPFSAIEHLLQDQDQHAAIALLTAHADTLLAEGRVRRLLRWFALLQPTMIKQIADTPLNLSRAWALVLNRRNAQAQPIIDHFLHIETSAGNLRLIRQARTLQCLQLSMTDHIEACHHQSIALLPQLDPDQILEQGVLVCILAYCKIASNQHDAAHRLMSQAMLRDHQLRTTFIRAVSEANNGIAELIHARPSHALTGLQSSYERIQRQATNIFPGGRANVGIPLAETLYELDELDRAQHILSECLPYARENGTVDALITSYVLSSRIALAGGDREAGLQYLKELENVATDFGLERAVASAQLEHVRLLWLQGEHDAAAQKLEHLETLDIWHERSGYQLPAQDIENPVVMRWRLQITARDARSAVGDLRQAILMASQSQHQRRSLKLRILLSLTFHAEGKLGPALQSLTEALQLASSERMIASFIDEGPRFQALLKLWVHQNGALIEPLGISTEFLSRLASHMPLSPAPTTIAHNTTRRESLTRRELEVLRHLAGGARNRAMAQRMFVSETTIKAHLRNISAKLGASSRTEAVAIARHEGLI